MSPHDVFEEDPPYGPLNQTTADTRYVHQDGTGLPVSVVSDSSASPKGIDSTGVADEKALIYDAASGKFKPTFAVIVTTQVGSSNGVDDAAAITSALAGGGRVKGKPGQTYLLASPVKLPAGGGVEADFTNSPFAFANTGVKCNMLQSGATTPVATATDVATTINTAVVTSPTLAAVATVGQVLAVVGAGPQGGNTADGANNIWLYGTVLSVAGNNITLTSSNVNGLVANSTGTGQTGYLFNRDKDVTLIGWSWDGGINWNTRADRTGAGFNSHQARLRRVDGLTIVDPVNKLSGFPQGGGWAFGISVADCTDIEVIRPKGVGASTTVQFDGPIDRATVTGAHGQTQDDHVAAGCVGFQGNDTEGDITNLVIEDTQANGSWTAVDLFAGQGSHGIERILRATVRGVKGTTVHSPVNLVDYTGAGVGRIYLHVDDMTAKPGPGLQGINNTATYGFVTRSPANVYHASDSGHLLSSFDPNDVPASGGLTLGGGFVYLVMLKALVPVSVANLLLHVKTAGGTLAGGQNFAWLCDPQGQMGTPGGIIAKTTDRTADWQITGLKVMGLTAQPSYSLDLPGGPGVFYWAAIVSNGTTKPTFFTKATQGTNMHSGLGNPYAAAVPGARHRAGYESVGGRTGPLSLNGLTVTDAGLVNFIWAACT